MSDSIDRQQAIDEMLMLPKYFDKTGTLCLDYADVLAVLSEHLSSVQPVPPIKEKCAYCPHCENCGVNDDLRIAQPTYTDAEIQKMWNLESAEIEKVYQIGYEEGKKDAQPEIKKGVGHWEPKEHWLPLPPNTELRYFQNYNPITNSIKTHCWHCSECDYIGSKDTKPTWNFCPHCGADMR